MVRPNMIPSSSEVQKSISKALPPEAPKPSNNSGVSEIIKRFNYDKSGDAPPPAKSPVSLRKKLPTNSTKEAPGNDDPLQDKPKNNSNHAVRLVRSAAITEDIVPPPEKTQTPYPPMSSTIEASGSTDEQPPEIKPKRNNRVVSMIAAFEKSAPPSQVSTSATVDSSKATVAHRWPRKQEELRKDDPSSSRGEAEPIPVPGVSYPYRDDVDFRSRKVQVQRGTEIETPVTSYNLSNKDVTASSASETETQIGGEGHQHDPSLTSEPRKQQPGASYVGRLGSGDFRSRKLPFQHFNVPVASKGSVSEMSHGGKGPIPQQLGTAHPGRTGSVQESATVSDPSDGRACSSPPRRAQSSTTKPSQQRLGASYQGYTGGYNFRARNVQSQSEKGKENSCIFPNQRSETTYLTSENPCERAISSPPKHDHTTASEPPQQRPGAQYQRPTGSVDFRFREGKESVAAPSLSERIDVRSRKIEHHKATPVECKSSDPAKQNHAVISSHELSKRPISSTSALGEIHTSIPKSHLQVPAAASQFDFGELSPISGCGLNSLGTTEQQAAEVGQHVNNCDDSSQGSVSEHYPETTVVSNNRPSPLKLSPPSRSSKNTLQIRISQLLKKNYELSQSRAVSKGMDLNLMPSSLEPTEEPSDDSYHDVDIKVTLVDQDLSADDMRQPNVWKKETVPPLASLCDRSMDVPALGNDPIPVVTPGPSSVKLLKEKFEKLDFTVYSVTPSSPIGTEHSQEGFEVNASDLSMEIVMHDPRTPYDCTQNPQAIEGRPRDDEWTSGNLYLTDVSRSEVADDSAHDQSEEEAWTSHARSSRSSKHKRKPSYGDRPPNPPGSAEVPPSFEGSSPSSGLPVENAQSMDSSLSLALDARDSENGMSMVNRLMKSSHCPKASHGSYLKDGNTKASIVPPTVEPAVRLDSKRDAEDNKVGADLNDDSDFEPPVVRKAPPSTVLLMHDLDFLAPPRGEQQLSNTTNVLPVTTSEKNERGLTTFKLPPNPRDTGRSMKSRFGPSSDESHGACPLSITVERSAPKPNETNQSRIKMLAAHVSEQYHPYSSPTVNSAALPPPQYVQTSAKGTPSLKSCAPSVPVDLDVTPADSSLEVSRQLDASLISEGPQPEPSPGPLAFDSTEESLVDPAQLDSTSMEVSEPSPITDSLEEIEQGHDSFDVEEKRDDSIDPFQIGYVVSTSCPVVVSQPVPAVGLGLIAPSRKDTPAKTKPRPSPTTTNFMDRITQAPSSMDQDTIYSSKSAAEPDNNTRLPSSPPPEQPVARQRGGAATTRNPSQTNPMWTRLDNKERMMRWRQIRRSGLPDVYGLSSCDEYESTSDRDYDGDNSASNPTKQPTSYSYYGNEQQWKLFNPLESNNNHLTAYLSEPTSVLRPRLIEKESKRTSSRSRKSPRIVPSEAITELVEI